MKKILLLLAIVLMMVSCQKKGAYQYLIYMNDGEVVKAWSVEPSGGGLSVTPPMGTSGHYYLSSSTYTKAQFVGSKGCGCGSNPNR